MDRVVVNCPSCSLGHRLPVATQGEVVCRTCGERFHADTRTFDRAADETVRDNLSAFDDAPRDLSYGRRPPPVPTPIEGGAMKAMFNAAKGVCPHCRHTMNVGLAESRCPHCDHYSMRREDHLQPIPEDYVAATHVFNVPMEAFQRDGVPAICCACGERATRLIKMTYAQAPHCGQHSVGGVTSTEEGRFGILVKSHRFYCAAMMSGPSILF